MLPEPISKSAKTDSSDGDLNNLQLQITKQLRQPVDDFELSFVEGGLLIRGQTQTYYAKQMAQEAVMELTDLPIIANSIQVKRA